MIREGWALLAEIGLWGWIFTTIGLIVHSFSGKTFNGRKALPWGAMVVVLYTVWVVAMLKA